MISCSFQLWLALPQAAPLFGPYCSFGFARAFSSRLELTGNYLIENPGYPKRVVVRRPGLGKRSVGSSAILDLTNGMGGVAAATAAAAAPALSRGASGLELGREPTKDYDNTSGAVSATYREMCEIQLGNEFLWLGGPAIKAALAECNQHFTPARKKLRTIYGEVPEFWNPLIAPPNAKGKLLKKPRKAAALPDVKDDEFIRELAWAKRDDEWARAEREWSMRKKLTDSTNGAEEIECGCCCCEYSFEDVRSRLEPEISLIT